MIVVPCCFLWSSFEKYEIQTILYNHLFLCQQNHGPIAVLPFVNAVNQFILMVSYHCTYVPSGLTMDFFPCGLHCRFPTVEICFTSHPCTAPICIKCFRKNTSFVNCGVDYRTTWFRNSQMIPLHGILRVIGC